MYINYRLLKQCLTSYISTLIYFRRPSVIYIMLLQSLSTLPHIWGTTLLTVTLQPLGVSQKTIGILIIVTTLVEFITTIFVARYEIKKVWIHELSNGIILGDQFFCAYTIWPLCISDWLTYFSGLDWKFWYWYCWPYIH